MKLLARPRLPLPRRGLLRSSSFRFTLLYAAFFGGSVLVLFAVVAWSLTRYAERELDTTVINEIAEVEAAAQPKAGLPRRTMQQVIEDMTKGSPGTFYLLQSAQGQRLAGNLAPMSQHLGPRNLRGRDALGEGIRGAGEFLPDGSYLFVGVSSAELTKMRQAVANAFLLGLAATLALALAGGLAMSTTVLRRIDAISRASRDIMAGDFNRRIALRNTGDEFDRLAASLNAMIDRIQRLMTGLQQVSNDIAHDLRTPLTRLRQRLELARGDNAEALDATLEGSIADLDTVLDTFGALLRIAQVEAGTRRAGFDRVDLRAVLESVYEAYLPSAEEQDQHFTLSAPEKLPVLGDRELLVQMTANLVANAITHCPRGVRIALSLERGRGRAVIQLADTGPGIPVGSRISVFDRYARLDCSRTVPGSGLGLALCQAIAHLHEGSIVLEDNSPGLRVMVALPVT